MTTHSADNVDVLHFDGRQYASFVVLAFAIWLTGVAMVRILPAAAFDTDEPWPILLFIASIGLSGTPVVPVMRDGVSPDRVDLRSSHDSWLGTQFAMFEHMFEHC